MRYQRSNVRGSLDPANAEEQPKNIYLWPVQLRRCVLRRSLGLGTAVARCSKERICISARSRQAARYGGLTFALSSASIISSRSSLSLSSTPNGESGRLMPKSERERNGSDLDNNFAAKSLMRWVGRASSSETSGARASLAR